MYSTLRRRGHEIIGYIDDSYLKGDSYDSCALNVEASVKLLKSLGFIIHPEKSALIPSQTAQFLGFIIDSVHMTVSLTEEKKEFIKSECENLLVISLPTIRQVARVIGILVAAFPGVEFGPLYYIDT